MTNDGGPAFPHMMAVGHKDYAGGLSLRDYFAAQAMPRMIELMFRPPLCNILENDTATAGVVAQKAYLFADAMIKARLPHVTGLDDAK